MISDLQRGLFVLDASPALETTNNKCLAGNPVDPKCDSCALQVCVQDPVCCANWDAQCVEAVQTVCDSLTCGASAGSCAHTLCETGGPLVDGCDSPPAASSCVAAICAQNTSCCDEAWDDSCVAAVAGVCGKNCN